jgi:hypothetical protein
MMRLRPADPSLGSAQDDTEFVPDDTELVQDDVMTSRFAMNYDSPLRTGTGGGFSRGFKR